MSCPQAHRAAADSIEFLQQLPLLSARDKRGVLGLIRHTLAHDFVCVLNTHNGISIFRSTPDQDLNSNRIYRVSGMGEVPEDPKVVFELLCNLDLIPEWDMLYKGAKYLNFIRDPAGRCEVGYIHLVYGLPGVSQFVSDRDFILRTVRVFFPNGMHVLYCHSVGAGEHVQGSPGPLPNMIRGQMWDSGYVVVPTAGGCCLNITLQVDPKGWIPTSVVNFSLEAIPLNIQRIRSALERLPAGLLQQLTQRNQHQAAACKRLPPIDTLGPGSTSVYMAYSTNPSSKGMSAGRPQTPGDGMAEGFDDQDACRRSAAGGSSSAQETAETSVTSSGWESSSFDSVWDKRSSSSVGHQQREGEAAVEDDREQEVESKGWFDA